MKNIIPKAILLILIGIFLIGCVPQEEINKRNRCEAKEDGIICSAGMWYDQFGRACGGQSCVGLGLGKCFNEECIRINDFYEMLFGEVDDKSKIDICFDHESTEFLIYCLDKECLPEGHHCLYKVLTDNKDDKPQLRLLCKQIEKNMGEIAEKHGYSSIPSPWKAENCIKRFNF